MPSERAMLPSALATTAGSPDWNASVRYCAINSGVLRCFATSNGLVLTISVLRLFRQSLCKLAILLLRTFIAAAKNNEIVTLANVVDPIARPVVNSHFAHARSNWSYITGVAKF